MDHITDKYVYRLRTHSSGNGPSAPDLKGWTVVYADHSQIGWITVLYRKPG